MNIRIYKIIFLLALGLSYSCSKGPTSEPTVSSGSALLDNIFQLKVLNQKTSECSLHDTRNLLFSMAMLDDNKKNYESEYKLMLDEQLLDKMALLTNCRINVWGHGERSSPDIKGFLDTNKKYYEFLPLKSINWIKDIVEIEMYNKADNFRKMRKFIAEKIAKIEPDYAEDSSGVDDAALLASLSTGPNGQYKSVRFPLLDWEFGQNWHEWNTWREFLSGQRPFLGIKLGLISTGSIGHATSLLLYKEDGKIKALFMDPLNWKLNNTENYKKIIEPLFRLLINEEYYLRTIIRARVFAMMYPQESDESLPRWVSRVHRYGLRLVDDPVLSNNSIDKLYKKEICTWMKNFKAHLESLSSDKKKEINDAPLGAAKLENSEKILTGLKCDKIDQ